MTKMQALQLHKHTAILSFYQFRPLCLKFKHDIKYNNYSKLFKAMPRDDISEVGGLNYKRFSQLLRPIPWKQCAGAKFVQICIIIYKFFQISFRTTVFVSQQRMELSAVNLLKHNMSITDKFQGFAERIYLLRRKPF